MNGEIRSLHKMNGEGFYGGIVYPALSLMRVLAKDENTSLIIYAPSNYNGYSELKVQLIDNEVLEQKDILSNIIYLNQFNAADVKKISKFLDDKGTYTVNNGATMHEGEPMAKVYGENIYDEHGGNYTPVNILFIKDKFAIVENALDGKYKEKNPFIVSTTGYQKKDDYFKGNIIGMLQNAKSNNKMKGDISYTIDETLKSIKALEKILNDEYCLNIVKEQFPSLNIKTRVNLDNFFKNLNEQYKLKMDKENGNFEYARKKYLENMQEYSTYEKILKNSEYVKEKKEFEERKQRYKEAVKDINKTKEELVSAHKKFTLDYKKDVEKFKLLTKKFENALRNNQDTKTDVIEA